MAADEFDWRPHGQGFWVETAQLRGIRVNERQMMFACARQRGCTQGEAAMLAGYARRPTEEEALDPDVAQRLDDDARKKGSDIAAGTGVRALLSAADERLRGGGSDRRRGFMDDDELEERFHEAARIGNTSILKELWRERKQREHKQNRSPEDSDPDKALAAIVRFDGSHANLYAGAVAIFAALACGRSILNVPALAEAKKRCPQPVWDFLVKNIMASPASRKVLAELLGENAPEDELTGVAA